MSKPVVLLFGLPRSGTTWIGKLFDSHPHTLYLHEPDSWGRLNWLPMFADGAVEETDRRRIEAFVAALPDARETKVRASTPVFPKAYLGGIGNRVFLASAWTAKLLARLTGECPLPWTGRAGHGAQVQPVWKSIESLGRLRWLLGGAAAGPSDPPAAASGRLRRVHSAWRGGRQVHRVRSRQRGFRPVRNPGDG